jgi:NAD(P)H-dependent FMN reductase
MLKVAIVLGSTRPGRVGEVVVPWIQEIASRRDDATFTLVDVAKLDLPFLDESMPPIIGQYANQHTKDWAAIVDSFDAYVFVTPEYNRSIPAALKNAIDFVHAEWNNKAAGFVSYGSNGGVRAVEHLRLVMAELQVATVRDQLSLNSFLDFENFYTFKPTAQHEKTLETLFDQVISWGTALKSLRP